MATNAGIDRSATNGSSGCTIDADGSAGIGLCSSGIGHAVISTGNCNGRWNHSDISRHICNGVVAIGRQTTLSDGVCSASITGGANAGTVNRRGSS